MKTSGQFNETYEYDPRGNRTSRTTDQKLNLEFAAYGYDEWNRLTHAEASNQGAVDYTYNGDDQLYERIENGFVTRYYWDEDKIIAEATVTGTQVIPKVSFVYGNGLLAQIDPGSLSRSHYLLNAHQDVVELRDGAGNIQNAYTYDIWGKPLTENEQVYNPFRYSSELWDSKTKLLYLSIRWYDTETGRFLQEDTFEGELKNPLSLNLCT